MYHIFLFPSTKYNSQSLTFIDDPGSSLSISLTVICSNPIPKFPQSVSGKFISKLTSFHLLGVSDLFFFSLCRVGSCSTEAAGWVEPSGGRDDPRSRVQKRFCSNSPQSLGGWAGVWGRSLREGKTWFVVLKRLDIQSWRSEVKPGAMFEPMGRCRPQFSLRYWGERGG